VLEEQPLYPDLHDRAGFSCGISELDDYRHRFALQHRRKGVSTVHVLVDEAQPDSGLPHGQCCPGG
jgi:hypothetical protein